MRFWPGEVTHSTLVPGRVSRLRVADMHARFMPRVGLGGVEDYKGDSSAVIRSKITGFQLQLARAKQELGACADAGRVIVGILTAGVTSTECYLKWSGQVGWFEDRINEATAALNIAVQREKAAKANADAAAQALAMEVASEGSAMTGGGTGSGVAAQLGGIPTWAKVVGGVVLLGGAAFMLTRVVRK